MTPVFPNAFEIPRTPTSRVSTPPHGHPVPRAKRRRHHDAPRGETPVTAYLRAALIARLGTPPMARVTDPAPVTAEVVDTEDEA